MTNKVRVRFAPSPTGPLHIGGVRTALFNYLFAKKNNGTFILRIEDTDQKRYIKNAEKYIIDALNWCNIPYDEGIDKDGGYGPYRQSERKTIYKEYAQQLINSGFAYYSFDTSVELDTLRKNDEKNGKRFVYNHSNRNQLNNSLSLSEDEIVKKLKTKIPFVIRFKTPINETLLMKDIIRGEIKIDTNVLDDKILFKSDGMPTYHLANIVDDHLMQITHVIRGEEWLPSMPLHILLYKAFNWSPPEFAHLPLILKPVGKGKLSKRDGDKLGFPVFPLNYTNLQTSEVSSGYKEAGYFSDAFINMLALLGWNPGTEQELFTLAELVESFDLTKVGKHGSKFDPEKTHWFQHQYLIKKSDEELSDLFLPILKEKIGLNTTNTNSYYYKTNALITNTSYLNNVINLLKERATFVEDFWELGKFFYLAPTEFDVKAVKKQWKDTTPELMQELITILNNTTDFTSVYLENIVKEWVTSKEIGFGKVMNPFRLSLVGALKGPHLFDICALLGKEETINRITYAIQNIKNTKS